jgi:uncharacterized protein
MHLTLHLTSRCNLVCRYCYQTAGGEDMTVETAIDAIRRCATGSNCGIIFFGGEPLLKKDLIWEIMDWAEGTSPGRFHYKVTTNGLLMDEPFLDEARRRRLHVALSHDGVKKAHDRHRVGPDGGGTFDRLLSPLKELLARMPYSPVMMTVNPDTVDCFADSAAWLQEQGVQYLIASLNYAGPWTEASLRRLAREYLALKAWHYDNYVNERKIYFSPFDKRIASGIRTDSDSSCRLGRRQISVSPDGRLYPCVQFVGRDAYVIGTAREGLDEARRNVIFEANECDKKTCVGCVLQRRCPNKCGCLNIQTTGRLDAVPPLVCEHERLVLPLADSLAERLYRERVPMFIQRHYNPAFPVLSFLEDLG